MAFTGWAVACGYGGAAEGDNNTFDHLSHVQWSENLASAATTTNVAPADDPARGRPIMKIDVAADYWISVAPVPDTTAAVSTTLNNIRFLVRSGTTFYYYPKPGDKVMGTAA
jgi:hypothetical protein